jgi:Na+/H+-dicarboxylate symporter
VWFHFPFSSIISSDNALIVGIVLGLLIALIPSLRALEKHIIASREFLCKIIKLGFIPLIPLYVFGFILSLQQTGGLSIIVKNYLITFLITWTLIISYIFFLYFAGANFNFKRCLEFIKRIFPALITAFSTMSSAATIPITLNATEKNTENKEYARFVIPTTASIHMIAGNIIVTILGLSLLQFSGAKFPTLIEFLPFVFYFCLAKFSAVGVPGGSIIVLIPVVEKYLGLNEELSTLLLSICLLTDALETAGNVAGNGAFAILANKVLAFNQKLKLAEQ